MVGGQWVVRQKVSDQTDNRWSSRHSVVRTNSEQSDNTQVGQGGVASSGQNKL